MSKILLFVGLPGSGKTYYANEICDVVVDDIVDLSQLPHQFDILGITDVNFCDELILNKAKTVLRNRYDCEIEVIYFENNPAKCRKNVEYRNDGRAVEGTILRFEKTYNPPANALKIWTL
jgi:predicted kinase